MIFFSKSFKFNNETPQLRRVRLLERHQHHFGQAAHITLPCPPLDTETSLQSDQRNLLIQSIRIKLNLIHKLACRNNFYILEICNRKDHGP